MRIVGLESLLILQAPLFALRPSHQHSLDTAVRAVWLFGDAYLGRCDIPLLKHRILIWFPKPSAVNAVSVGEKNMASSSGWAMSRHMRLFRSVGREAFAI